MSINGARAYWVISLVSLPVLLGGCGASLTGESGRFQPIASEQRAAPIRTSSLPAGPTGAVGAKGANAPSSIEQLQADIQPGNAAYKIGPQDLLEISVFKVPELSRSVQVGETGMVNFPLIGEIQASERTAQHLERDLTQRLGSKYLQSPQVAVYVREFNSQRVTVEGAVKKPGVYPIRGRLTILQLMAQCEGIDREIATNEVVVFRVVDGKRQAAHYDIDSIRAGATSDPPVLAGDVVVVTPSDAKVIFNNILKAAPIASALRPL